MKEAEILTFSYLSDLLDNGEREENKQCALNPGTNAAGQARFLAPPHPVIDVLTVFTCSVLSCCLQHLKDVLFFIVVHIVLPHGKSTALGFKLMSF